MTYWKIVDRSAEGEIKTLFHGVKGSRKLPKRVWLKAELKLVTDGSGPQYLSGWHVLPSRQVAEKYLERFTTRLERLTIVPCQAKNLRRKSHARENVFLAEYIKLL